MVNEMGQRGSIKFLRIIYSTIVVYFYKCQLYVTRILDVMLLMHSNLI